jgi:hypothetical protein
VSDLRPPLALEQEMSTTARERPLRRLKPAPGPENTARRTRPPWGVRSATVPTTPPATPAMVATTPSSTPTFTTSTLRRPLRGQPYSPGLAPAFLLCCSP